MKQLFVTLLIFIGIIGVIFNLLRVSQMEFYVNNLKVNLYPHNISLEKTLIGDNTEKRTEIVRLSPFDDYFYTREKKNHFWDEKNFTPYQGINEMKNKFNNYFYHKTGSLSWSYTNKDNNLTNNYQLDFKNKEITITRSYFNLDPRVYAIGQSVVICKTCYIIGEQNEIFINSESYSREKLEFAEQNNLTPVILTDQLFPDTVTKVIVIDENLKPVFSLIRNPGEEMYFDDKWQLIEIKRRISEPNVKLIQKVEVY